MLSVKRCLELVFEQVSTFHKGEKHATNLFFSPNKLLLIIIIGMG